jgi:tocopherol cyclase
MNIIRSTLNPDLYHGHGRKPPFFEGWYYKLVSADEQQRYAIIPGIILGSNGHSFVQLLNGSTGESIYFTFPPEEFWATQNRFEVRIGENTFTHDRIKLHIDDQTGKLSGELHFEGITPWPISLTSPGIMGWYAWVPRMETYHGVVSLDHSITGSLKINAQDVLFNLGRGYIEKDWGASFPSAWIWFQSNHFEKPGTSLTASVAIIPWLNNSFRGFICGIWHQGQLYRFATYTGAKIENLEIFDDHIDWNLRERNYRLEMTASRARGGLILGPDRIEMGKRVNETMLSTVEVRLSSLSGELIFDGVGRNAGLEAHGDLEKLLSYQ